MSPRKKKSKPSTKKSPSICATSGSTVHVKREAKELPSHPFVLTVTCPKCGKRMGRDGENMIHPVVGSACARAGNRYNLPTVDLSLH